MCNTSISNTQLNVALSSKDRPVIFDVRKKPAFDRDPDTLPSAEWQIHDDVQSWSRDLPYKTLIVVYCVHGHEVSQNAARVLRNMGFDACYLKGGIDGWKQAGLPIVKGTKK